MKTIEELLEVVSANDELIERAKLILDGAPYFTYIPEEQYVRLRINGGEAILVWPESHSGYYDSCSIEEQSKGFPVELLLMTRPEIEFWTAEQKRIYDDAQRIWKEQKARTDAENRRQNELNTLAALKAKYE